MMKTPDIEYFRFEEDFMEDNLRCIPMIVRLRLDTVGIKLPLRLWSRLNSAERTLLAVLSCNSAREQTEYKNILLTFGRKYSDELLAVLPVAANADWNREDCIPWTVREKFIQSGQEINPEQWRSLSALQRFALVKLSRPGHESKNFGKAIAEFGLSDKKS
jgi:hypothetical protein